MHVSLYTWTWTHTCVRTNSAKTNVWEICWLVVGLVDAMAASQLSPHTRTESEKSSSGVRERGAWMDSGSFICIKSLPDDHLFYSGLNWRPVGGDTSSDLDLIKKANSRVKLSQSHCRAIHHQGKLLLGCKFSFDIASLSLMRLQLRRNFAWYPPCLSAHCTHFSVLNSRMSFVNGQSLRDGFFTIEMRNMYKNSIKNKNFATTGFWILNNLAGRSCAGPKSTCN